MTTITFTVEIAVTGEKSDKFAFGSLGEIADEFETGLLDAFGFPEHLDIKIKMISRAVT